LGLAAALYLGYASFFVLGQACLLCVATYVAVIGVFLVSGAAASDLGAIPRRLGSDVKAVTGSPAAIGAAVVWLALAAGVLAWSPREQPVAAAAASAPAVMPTETLGPNEVAQFEAWLGAQPRVDLTVPAGAGARVVVVKFNDYQCPACRQAYVAYKAIQQRYETEHAGQVAFVSLDYPLEAECNDGGIHAAACEAAVAVRLARGRNRSREMEEWLFDNQDTLTRDRVKEGLAEVAQISDFDAQYSRVLEDVRAEAQMGQKLQITGTPTFFINGIRIASTLRPAYFDAAIAYELKRTQSATP
jgi:protein-disulfide isomerase